MFAIKWLFGSVVESVVDTSKRSLDLAQNTIQNTTGNVQNYVQHINDKSSTEVISNYKTKTNDIVNRQNYRRKLVAIKNLTDCQKEIQFLINEVETEIKELQSKYQNILFGNALRNKKAEKEALESLLDNNDMETTKKIAEQKFENLLHLKVATTTPTMMFLRHVKSIDVEMNKRALKLSS